MLNTSNEVEPKRKTSHCSRKKGTKRLIVALTSFAVVHSLIISLHEDLVIKCEEPDGGAGEPSDGGDCFSKKNRARCVFFSF